MSELSEVRIVISQEGEKFTGHVFAAKQERLTMEHKERSKAVNQAFQVARNALMEDNIPREKSHQDPNENTSSQRPPGRSRDDSRSKSG